MKRINLFKTLSLTLIVVLMVSTAGCNKNTGAEVETAEGGTTKIQDESMTDADNEHTEQTEVQSETTAVESTDKGVSEETSSTASIIEGMAGSEKVDEETSGEGIIEVTTAEIETETTTAQAVVISSEAATTAHATAAPTQPAPTEASTTHPEATTQAPTVHSHSYSEAITANATCTSNGNKKFTCSCGHSYTETIYAYGHNFGSYSYNNDATYEGDGTESATCSNCGHKDTRTSYGTKLVHTHSYSETVTTSPTCTANGVKTFSCGCGHSYTESIGATGHSFGSYVYNNDATTEADGTETATCSLCGATDTRTATGTKKEEELPSWDGPELGVIYGDYCNGAELYLGSVMDDTYDWTEWDKLKWDAVGFGYGSSVYYYPTQYKEGWIAKYYTYKLN